MTAPDPPDDLSASIDKAESNYFERPGLLRKMANWLMWSRRVIINLRGRVNGHDDKLAALEARVTSLEARVSTTKNGK